MPPPDSYYFKDYAKKNRDKVLAYKREYYYRNRERLKEETRIRNYERYHNDPKYRKNVIKRSLEYKKMKRDFENTVSKEKLIKALKKINKKEDDKRTNGKRKK